MDQDEPDLARRVSEIQAQVERLSAAISHPVDNLQQFALMESRLSQLTQQCADILDRWTLTDLRHARAIGEMEARLNDWQQLETRVEHDAHERLRELERKIEHEWLSLRHLLEQPVHQIQEHAASLRETSIATAGSALTGLERAETRLATIQSDLADRMTQLSREVQTMIAELRAGQARPGQAGAAGVPSWPLDQVMRLHNELRENDGADEEHAAARPPKTIALLPETTTSLTQRIESVEHAVTDEREHVRELERAESQGRSLWRGAVLVLAVALVAAGFFAIRLQRQIQAATAQIAAAEQEAVSARMLADKQIAVSQQNAERQIAQARDTAMRAQIVSDVLAAPDLVRYGLAGGDTAPLARGQLLWSRSRGLVFSATRMPDVPASSTYQLWLVTASGPFNAGLPKAEGDGRLSLATETVPLVPRPVLGVVVTMEPEGGRPEPSGAAVLTFRPQPQ